MKKSNLKFLTFTFVILLSSCAATYRPINPPTLHYNSHEVQDGFALSYKYDVLREKGNSRYANKENRKGVKLIAVQLTNNTDTIINIGKDVAFFSGENQIFPMDPNAIKESIKQIVPAYLPYLLLTLVNLNVTTSKPNRTTTDVYPIGLVLGPGITLGNMYVARSANNRMLNELYKYNILNRDIQKGETVYGIIGVRDLEYGSLSVKRIK